MLLTRISGRVFRALIALIILERVCLLRLSTSAAFGIPNSQRQMRKPISSFAQEAYDGSFHLPQS